MTPTQVAALLLALEALLVVTGVVLCIRGAVGSLRLAPPRCARCRHDLRTYGEPPTVCPECGLDVTRPGAISFARRRRRVGLVATGVLLVVLAAIAPAVVTGLVGLARAGAPAAPAALIPTLGEFLGRREATSPARPVRPVTDWITLASILGTVRPTPEEFDALVDAIERSGGRAAPTMEMQARHAMDDAMARLAGRLDGRDEARLAASWLGPVVVAVPDRVAAGEPWRVGVQAHAAVDREIRGRTGEGLGRSANPFEAAVRVVAVRVDGVPVDVSLSAQSTVASGRNASIPMPAADSPATREIEVVLRRSIMRTSDLPHAGVPDDPARWPPPLFEEEKTIQRKVRFVGPGEALVAQVVDPSLREQVNGALRIAACRIEGEGAARRLVVETTIVPPGGVSIAACWRLRVGGRTVDGGLLSAWGKPTNFGINGDRRIVVPLAPDESPTEIDVALEPSAEATAGLPRGNSPAWGEVIERRGVKVGG